MSAQVRTTSVPAERSAARAEALFQILETAVAGNEPRPVLQHHDGIPIAIGDEFLDATPVDEARAVNAHEPRGLERAFHLRKRGTQQVRLRADMQSHIVAKGLDEIDLFRPQYDDAIALLHEH